MTFFQAKIRFFRVISLFALLTCEVYSQNEYWDEFEKLYHEGKVKSLIEHVKEFSVIPKNITDVNMHKRSQALLYFLSTGGKYGFLDRPASKSEQEIMEDALLVSGIFAGQSATFDAGQYQLNILPLVAVRRAHGITFEDEKTLDHLRYAQRVFAYGATFARWANEKRDLLKISYSYTYVIPELFYGAYSQTMPQSIGNIYSFLEGVPTHLKKKIIDFTGDFFNLNSFYSKKTYPPISYDIIDEYEKDLKKIENPIDSVLTFSPYHMDFQATDEEIRPAIVILENGAMFLRRSDRSICYLSKSSDYLTTCENGSFSHDGISVDYFDNEEEFLAKITEYSPISISILFDNVKKIPYKEAWSQNSDYGDHSYPCSVTSRSTPNLELIRSLLEKASKECEDAKKVLETPEYESKAMQKEDSFQHLKWLDQFPRELLKVIILKHHFVDLSEFYGHELDWSPFKRHFLKSHIKSLEPGQDKENAQRIFQFMKDLDGKIKKTLSSVHYLNSPFYIPPTNEGVKSIRMTPTTLPTDPVVEEGQAKIEKIGDNLHITGLSDEVVITFEHFWLGENSNLVVNAANEDSHVYLYQRSTYPSFVFGSIDGAIGSLHLYVMIRGNRHVTKNSQIDIKEEKKDIADIEEIKRKTREKILSSKKKSVIKSWVSGGYYPPKDKRRYPEKVQDTI